MHAEAAFDAGNHAFARGDAVAAIEHYRDAAALAPEVAAVHCNLGGALLARGETAAAEAALKRALELEPGLAAAWNQLGNLLIATGAIAAAADAFRRALPLAAAAVNLGHALAQLGDPVGAEAAFRQAIAAGEAAAAWNGIGLLRHAAHDHAAAIDAFDPALKIEPHHLEARHNRAVALQALGRHHEALAALRELARQAPQSSAIQASLGHTLQGLGRHGEAIAAFEQALAGLAQGDRKAIALRPFLLHAKRQECRWDGIAGLEAKVLLDAEGQRAAGEAVTAPPFALAGIGGSPALIAAASQRISDAAVAAVAALPRHRAWRRQDGQNLRIGYLSPDFRAHSAGFSFEPLIVAHSRDGFEWVGYGLAPAESAFVRPFDRFVDLTASGDREAAARIHADGIDVLVDLAGHTKGSRLEILALTPAPVQVHYLGWGLALAAAFVPWLITDRQQTPPDLLVGATPAYLPDSFMAAGQPAIGAATTRAAAGLADDAIVLAAFNAPYKIEPEAFALWCEMLRRLPSACLWLRAAAAAKDRLRAAAEANGVDGNRLVFAPRLPRPEHLARLGLADLALDTLGHAGGVTTVDALWAGVPTVVLAGRSPAARTGVSLLHAVGLDQLIARDRADYLDIAVRLATDAAWRDTVKALLAARTSAPLFDVSRLARQLESAYRSMWSRWRDGLPPAALDVA